MFRIVTLISLVSWNSSALGVVAIHDLLVFIFAGEEVNGPEGLSRLPDAAFE
jgi:hypothetical protein